MPITNTSQASIVMSKVQAEAVAKLIMDYPTPEFTIEETNLGDVICVKTNRGVYLVHPGGEVHKLGGASRRA